jgi:hypothetical protein
VTRRCCKDMLFSPRYPITGKPLLECSFADILKISESEEVPDVPCQTETSRISRRLRDRLRTILVTPQAPLRYLLRGADEFVTFPTHDTLLRTSVTIFSIPADLVDAEHRLKSVAHDGIVSYWVSECRGCCTLYSVQTRRTC